METMKEYVIRRAFEHKRYREVSMTVDVGYEWLCKLARNEIQKPNVDDIERLWRFYKALEAQEPRNGRRLAATSA
jgi:hypothetical protein